ncbi:2-phosphosulfolactate phosphatase [Paramicrobacterium agarici]|uniref:2-phosphosulfolactate phosphatase n=1 Tax=Paramicrobacterium agarici TaxID=630514 RepID=UPI001153AD7F|nr:2-phosphosulfolactate phosphatase [Microbacterium agarici]TQO23544.1 2-phosphosulfolactate phosphatase [Microbacterium agarici]
MSTEVQQQQRYEVRFEWGSTGLETIAEGAGVVIVAQGIADGHPLSTEIEARGRVRASEWVEDAARATGARVYAASLRNRTAVAQRVLQFQVEQGDRVRVAVVAETASEPNGSGFAVDALFAGGAIVDALAAVGIDYASPEAAAASAAFTGLERAVGHLFTASTAGQKQIAAGRRDDVVAAGKVDVSELVPVLGADGYWAAG